MSNIQVLDILACYDHIVPLAKEEKYFILKKAQANSYNMFPLVRSLFAHLKIDGI